MPGLSQAIILSLKLDDTDTGQTVRATVIDDLGASVGVVILTHITLGLYQDASLVMPNRPYVTAIYETFTDGTFATKCYFDTQEVYILEEDAVNLINMGMEDVVVTAESDADSIVEAILEDENEIEIIVEAESLVETEADTENEIESQPDSEIIVEGE